MLEIIQKPIKDIKPYAENPRKNKNAVALVANSIREFGFKVPIILNSENVIIAGHTRIEAAKSLGMEEVPCILADDLTEEQVKAFRLADNKTAEAADWDTEKLIKELSVIDIDMTEFGFDLSEDFYSDDKYLKEQISPAVKSGGECTCPQCGFTFEV